MYWVYFKDLLCNVSEEHAVERAEKRPDEIVFFAELTTEEV